MICTYKLRQKFQNSEKCIKCNEKTLKNIKKKRDLNRSFFSLSDEDTSVDGMYSNNCLLQGNLKGV